MSTIFGEDNDLRTVIVKLIDSREEKDGFELSIYAHINHYDNVFIISRISINVENLSMSELKAIRTRVKKYISINYDCLNTPFIESFTYKNGEISLILTNRAKYGTHSGVYGTTRYMFDCKKVYEQYRAFANLENIPSHMGQFIFSPNESLVQFFNEINVDIEWNSHNSVLKALRTGYDECSKKLLEFLSEFRYTHSVERI